MHPHKIVSRDDNIFHAYSCFEHGLDMMNAVP